MIAVQMSGADDDLKGLITASGIRGGHLEGLDTGEPTSKAYVQLGLFHIKAGRYNAGLYYIEVALTMDPESLVSSNICTCIRFQKYNLVEGFQRSDSYTYYVEKCTGDTF